MKRFLSFCKFIGITTPIIIILSFYLPANLRYRQWDKPHVPRPMKGVIILTNYRSGSTFFGQLFNQHPEVFYTFEPLVLAKDGDLKLQNKLLRSALTCQFNDVSSIIDGNAEMSPTIHQCLRENVCFRIKMKNLCEAPLCPPTKTATCGRCGRIATNTLRNLCSAKVMSVVKVIRLRHLDNIRELLEDTGIDIKVLHLVRDPRGISSSRQLLGHDENMKYTCNRMQHNGMMGFQGEAPWLEGKYKLVRYEDVARNPVEMAKRIYEFLGLRMTRSILRWIKTDTRGDVSSSSDFRTNRLRLRNRKNPPIAKENFTSMVLKDAYSTVRFSNSTWSAWQKHLNHSAILDVQRDCKYVMEMFGYNTINDGNGLRTQNSLRRLENFTENALYC